MAMVTTVVRRNGLLSQSWAVTLRTWRLFTPLEERKPFLLRSAYQQRQAREEASMADEKTPQANENGAKGFQVKKDVDQNSIQSQAVPNLKQKEKWNTTRGRVAGESPVK